MRLWSVFFTFFCILSKYRIILKVYIHWLFPKIHLQATSDMFIFLVGRDFGVSLWGRISCLPEQPRWLYA